MRTERSYADATTVVPALAVLFLAVPIAFPAAKVAAFPGTNGLLVFTSSRDGNSEVYSMNPDGSGQTNLTNNPASDSLPAWSPDGNRIVFVSNRDGNEEIYTMDADGSNVIRLTANAAVDRYPAWSPDGTQIVFASLRQFPWKIFVMDSADNDADGNGDNLIQLTNISASDLVPAWSPDGTRIAFVSDRTGFAQIFVMSAADGSNQVRLTTNTVQNQVPNWSPDGTRITFSTALDGNPEIYVMDAVDADADGNGDNPIRLTNDPGNDYDPSWSPDGNNIAFHSNRSGVFEIYVMGADGSNQANVSLNPTDDLEVDWGASSESSITVPPLADTYLKQGHPNKNFGNESILRVRQSGKNRALVQFGQGSIDAAIGAGTLSSATLRLYIVFNGNNWGSDGRDVGVFRMHDAWTELGATWKCDNDTNTSNRKPDCEQWEMGNSSLWPFEAVPAAIHRHTNQLFGWVEWDVTADVQGFVTGATTNNGWIVKKLEEGQAGHIQYSSSEGSFAPELVIVSQ